MAETETVTSCEPDGTNACIPRLKYKSFEWSINIGSINWYRKSLSSNQGFWGSEE